MGSSAFFVYLIAAFLLHLSELLFSRWVFMEGHKAFMVFYQSAEVMLLSFAFYNLRANERTIYGMTEFVFAFSAAAIAVSAYELAYFAPYQADALLPKELQSDKRWLDWEPDTIAWFSVAGAVWVFIRALANIEDGIVRSGNIRYLRIWKWMFGVP